ncbi:NSFL1 cofactor p47 [Halotydeus destructor]|nr:NSFL1 cofactor p47 [Halotydeus destructor]
MDADHDSLISSFVSVTGQDPDRSKLYLESTGWNLDLAIQTFYEEGDEAIEFQAQQPQVEEENSPIRPAAPSLSDLLNQPIGQATMSGEASGADKKKPARTGIATFGSLKQDDGSSSEEEGQAFYAGGSERSGQQILGPKGKKRDPNEVIAEMFKAAKEHGGESVDPSEAPQRSAASVFRGSGFRLGSEPGESPSVVGNPSEPARPTEMILRLWRNGFTVDDGDLRAFSDPANADFLASIKSGHIPRELVMMARGGEVSLNMEDHRSEEYVPMKKKAKAFEGEGHRLGSVVPPVEAAAASGSLASDEDAARNELSIDSSQPTSNIQIRLGDSTKLVLKVNLTSTVGQIRQFICRARPTHATRTFSLMTTFPNKELSDESLTVEQANLANAVIVQRFT